MQRVRTSLVLVFLLGIASAALSATASVDKQAAQTLATLEHNAAANNKSAQMKLAGIYLEGNGVTANIDKAIFYYRLAAEQDVAFAQHKLAGLYLTGDQVDPDRKKALNWLLRSAKLGFVQAQLDLSLLHENGSGTPRDFIQAHKWLSIASSLTDVNLTSKQESLEAKMNFAELLQARLLARICILSGYVDC